MYKGNRDRLRVRLKGPIQLSLRPKMMLFRYGHRSWARMEWSAVSTRFPLALLLTSLMVPGQVVGRRRVRMLFTILMHSEGVRGISWWWRMTTGCLVLMSWGEGGEGGWPERFRWFLLWRVMTV